MTTTNDGGRLLLDFLGAAKKREGEGEEEEEDEGKVVMVGGKQQEEAVLESAAGEGERAKMQSGGGIRDNFNLFSSYFRGKGKEKEGSAGGRPSMDQLGWFLKHHNPLAAGPTAATAQANRSTAAQQNGDPTQQLTIFYGGTVNVFYDISSEKVQAIMKLAAVSAAHAMKNAGEETNASEATAPPLSRTSSLHSTSNQAVHPAKLPTPTTKVVPSLCKSQSDLPIARRNSFQRFLEKRRDRLASKAPYPDVTKEGNEQASGETSKDRMGFSPDTPLEEDYVASANLATAGPRTRRHLTQAPTLSRRGPGPIKEP